MSDRPWLPRLAVTTGEPSGIGPELVAALAASDLAADLIAIGDKDALLLAAQTRGIALGLEADDGQWRRERAPGSLRYVHLPAPAPAKPGKLDARNAPYVIAMLGRAADGCIEGEFDALVTAPVHKAIINDGGIAFTGHTEFLAARARSDVAMMLVEPGLRVALATTHLPLAEVPAAITASNLIRVLRTVHNDLRQRFGIGDPRIAVLGLNPHAGEGGHLGREEIDIIAPTLAALRADGMRLEGPLSADTAFVPAQRARFDAYLAMYHDQGLPVLKALGFGDSVNVTLGLPFIRTSVDHGTALDLAGTGKADASSLIAAAMLAVELAARA
ncbi:MAG: 4-hydroxythreonine-4-phosphate dehydrogenase PdxA [Proteobacteria bacterium]|nr:4-hydroxythreonine-4-phosphate dehydrogenase PdxA [Pseudomonadota bacterium]